MRPQKMRVRGLPPPCVCVSVISFYVSTLSSINSLAVKISIHYSSGEVSMNHTHNMHHQLSISTSRLAILSSHADPLPGPSYDLQDPATINCIKCEPLSGIHLHRRIRIVTLYQPPPPTSPSRNPTSLIPHPTVHAIPCSHCPSGRSSRFPPPLLALSHSPVAQLPAGAVHLMDNRLVYDRALQSSCYPCNLHFHYIENVHLVDMLINPAG